MLQESFILFQMQQTKKLRILAMSDTHDLHKNLNISELPEADIFIHAGDFTQNSYRGELNRFITFLDSLPYKHKIVIAGNHDFVYDVENYPTKHKPKRHPHEKLDAKLELQRLKEHCIYLEHQAVEVEGIKIFGSPYQPLFYNWGFQYHSSKAEMLWSAVPKGIDLLITHGPPYLILDQDSEGIHAGCPELRKKVDEIQPKVHIFGHIHNGYGSTVQGKTSFYNASLLNEAYALQNPPHLIEIEVPV